VDSDDGGHRAAVFVVDLQRAAKVRYRPKADILLRGELTNRAPLSRIF
jgi:hypothetical protein